nr:MAG TPA: ARS binding protein 2 [Bacteriophage sp.]
MSLYFFKELNSDIEFTRSFLTAAFSAIVAAVFCISVVWPICSFALFIAFLLRMPYFLFDLLRASFILYCNPP